MSDPLTSSLQLNLEALLPRGSIFSAHWRTVGQPADAELLTSLDPSEARKYSGIRDPERRLEWVAGARCRLESKLVLDEQGWTDESFRITTSHSGGLALALAVVRPSSRTRSSGSRDWGVGVDLEPEARVVSSGVIRKLLDDGELGYGLSGLEAWTLKEAVWKAGDRAEGRVLSHYRIMSWDPASGEARVQCRVPGVPRGFRSFRGVLWRAGGFQFAAACTR
jgi:hypothetical protein